MTDAEKQASQKDYQSKREVVDYLNEHMTLGTSLMKGVEKACEGLGLKTNFCAAVKDSNELFESLPTPKIPSLHRAKPETGRDI